MSARNEIAHFNYGGSITSRWGIEPVFWGERDWQSARAIFLRMLDGMDSETLKAIAHAAGHVPRVEEVTDVRARWIGHWIHAELNVTVPGGLSVSEGHDIAREVRHQLLHHLPHLGGVTVHVDPYGQGGDSHHRIGEHAHDGLPKHSHE